MNDARHNDRTAIVFVVAIADNGVIGHDNAMPWHLSSDLKRFRALTHNHPVIMGRKTFASIGKPLPGRTNIVVTRDRHFRAPGVMAVTHLDVAFTLAAADAARRGVNEIMVIGGADVFAQWMERASRLEITEVHAKPEGDTFFPSFAREEWREIARTRHEAGAKDSSAYSHVTYIRAPSRC